MRATTRTTTFVLALLLVFGLVAPSAATAQQAQNSPTFAVTKDEDPKEKFKREGKEVVEGARDAINALCDSPWHYVTTPTFAACNVKTGVKKGVEIAKDPKKAVKTAAKEVAVTALDPFASNLAKFVGDMMKKGITWWLLTPSLTVGSSGVVTDLPEDEEHRLSNSAYSGLKLQGIMFGIGLMIAILLTIFQGIRTMIQRKGTPLLQVAQGLMMNVLVLAIGITVIDSLIVASDTLTKAILQAGFGEGGKEAPQKMVAMLLPSYGNPAGVLFMAVVVFLVGVVQLVMLFIRQAAIPVQALLLPIAGAGQIGADSTRKWLPRLISAILTCIAYKPAAALIFAIGFVEIDNSNSLVDWLRGVMTLVLAIFALKGLLGLFAPVGEVIGSAAAGGGGLAGGLMQLAGSMGNHGGSPSPAPRSSSGGGGGRTVVEQTQHMETHGPAANGGRGGPGASSDSSNSAVKQSQQAQIPQQQGANAGGQAAAAPAGQATAGSTAASGAAAGGGTASTAASSGAGGPASVAIVAAEAAKRTADKGGNTMGGKE